MVVCYAVAGCCSVGLTVLDLLFVLVGYLYCYRFTIKTCLLCVYLIVLFYVLALCLMPIGFIVFMHICLLLLFWLRLLVFYWYYCCLLFSVFVFRCDYYFSLLDCHIKVNLVT